MNEAINTIKQKYGDLCRLCPPLEEEKYPLAEKRFRRNTFPKVQSISPSSNNALFK
ncbi:MAG: hypothetical protein IKP25_07030 [Ruminococcus sp.]|nr:hypothetical protein [Ruminococcus sp.]